MSLDAQAEYLANGIWKKIDMPGEDWCSLGAETLADSDIYTEGLEQLEALEAEVKILLKHFELTGDDGWPVRLGYLLRVIDVAKQYKDAGRVVIS